MTIDDRLLAFLGRRRSAHLGTADAAGVPHVVPVCFAADAARAYILIDHKPKRGDPRRVRRLANIAANPEVCLTADHYEDDWRRLAWVMLRGRACILETGREHTHGLELLRRRYPQYRGIDGEGRPMIVVDVARAVSWGDLSV